MSNLRVKGPRHSLYTLMFILILLNMNTKYTTYSIYTLPLISFGSLYWLLSDTYLSLQCTYFLYRRLLFHVAIGTGRLVLKRNTSNYLLQCGIFVFVNSGAKTFYRLCHRMTVQKMCTESILRLVRKGY